MDIYVFIWFILHEILTPDSKENNNEVSNYLNHNVCLKCLKAGAAEHCTAFVREE